MVKGIVYINGSPAGVLEKKEGGGFRFTYYKEYLDIPSNPSVSVTLPKENQVHESDFMFPFFSGLLAEGINKEIQCRLLKIDENDDFTRLLRTAGDDTIGAVTIKEEKQ